MRKLAIAITLVLATARGAHADVAIGAFFGDPTGLDLKLGLAPRSALDIVLGWVTYHHFDDRAYGHVTYLVTPFVGHGDSVLVPLRVGIGGALYDPGDGNLDVAVRLPLEVGLRFRTAPLEIYGEIALQLTIIDPDHSADFDLVGGIGIRFYF